MSFRDIYTLKAFTHAFSQNNSKLVHICTLLKYSERGNKTCTHCIIKYSEWKTYIHLHPCLLPHMEAYFCPFSSCKTNYVNMLGKYVSNNIITSTRKKIVIMQVTNLLMDYFSLGKFLYHFQNMTSYVQDGTKLLKRDLFKLKCKTTMLTCLFMTTCNIFMSICYLFMSMWNIIMLTCKLFVNMQDNYIYYNVNNDTTNLFQYASYLYEQCTCEHK